MAAVPYTTDIREALNDAHREVHTAIANLNGYEFERPGSHGSWQAQNHFEGLRARLNDLVESIDAARAAVGLGVEA